MVRCPVQGNACSSLFGLVEDGNPDFIEGSKLNMEKVALLGRTVRTVRTFQRLPYRNIGNQIPALLHLLYAVPRMTEEQLALASEAIRPRQLASDSSESAGLTRMSSGTEVDAVSSTEAGSEEADMVELTLSSSQPGTPHGTVRRRDSYVRP